VYIRKSHRPRKAEDVVEFLRRHAFATLVTASSSGIVASHLPFLFEPSPAGDGGVLYAHMARANEHGELLSAGGESLVIFTGPHAYVSPSWYADRATAPTWDYVAIHCYGRTRIHHPEEAERNVRRLVDAMEAGGPNRWSMNDLPDPEIQAMLRNIISFEISVSRIEAKFKLNQGEKPDRTAAAIQVLEGSGQSELADYMKRYNDLL
jgi:transcriptional regulator